MPIHPERRAGAQKGPWLARCRRRIRRGWPGINHLPRFPPAGLRSPWSGPSRDGDLLHLHLGAGLLELALRLLGVLLGDLLEHRLGGAVDEILGLLEAQAR